MNATRHLFHSIYFDDLLDPDTKGRIENLDRNPHRVLDVIFPEKRESEPAVLFIHGGGWRHGHRSVYHRLMRDLVADGIACASADYTLQGTCLEQLRDVRHGYDLFRRLLTERGDPGHVVVMGSSSGAHLGQLLTLALPGACGEPLAAGDYVLDPAGWVQPTGLVSVTGPVSMIPGDNFDGIEASILNAVGVTPDQDPEAYRRVSPVEHVGPDSPPVFLVAAEEEDYFPLELNDRFLSRMRSHGRRVEYKVYPAEHGFLYDLVRPVQQQAWTDVLTFIRTLERVPAAERSA